ncbi:MAG: TonB-dependent receptor, partial [Verrucomicrobiota bacterium]
GSVNIVTKSVPPSPFKSYSFGIEYNEKTTFDDYLNYPGGGSDWLGSDDGTRAIPQVVLDVGELPISPTGASSAELDVIDEVAKSFSPHISAGTSKAPLNHSASYSFGTRYNLSKEPGGPVLGLIGSVNYKRSYSAYDDGQVGRYELVGRDLEIAPSQFFVETKGVDEAQWGTVLNAAVDLNNNHEIGLKTMYNQSGEDVAIFRTGSFPEAVADDTFQINDLHYTERTLSSFQAYGDHRFEAFAGLSMTWELSTGKSVQSEPDFRLFYDTEPASEFGRPSYAGNFPAPRRYWRELEEKTDEYRVDFTLPFGERSNEIKFGFRKTDTDREFQERAFIYQDSATGPYDGEPENFLSDQNVGYVDDGIIGRYIREFVGFVPMYNGIQTIDAAYLMGDYRLLDKLRLVAGARLEETKLEVQSFQANGNPFTNDGNLDNSDWLPALQVIKEIGEKQNLRFAFSKTLARPNFRELSPFGSFDNVGGEVFIGNPDLVRSRIENFDLRYEWFLDGGDLLAVSAFYKELENPIERNFKEGQLTYVNVPEGEVSGLELEVRKELGFISGDRYQFSAGGNLSVIESKVDRSDKELSDKRRRDENVSLTRELQGQSSLIANFDFRVERPVSGSSLSLVFNHTGERLYSVSDSALPDIYEEPFDSLDLIYSQDLPKGYKMKFSVKNAMDSNKTRVWADFTEDLIYSDYGNGTSFSLSFSKRFE